MSAIESTYEIINSLRDQIPHHHNQQPAITNSNPTQIHLSKSNSSIQIPNSQSKQQILRTGSIDISKKHSKPQQQPQQQQQSIPKKPSSSSSSLRESSNRSSHHSNKKQLYQYTQLEEVRSFNSNENEFKRGTINSSRWGGRAFSDEDYLEIYKRQHDESFSNSDNFFAQVTMRKLSRLEEENRRLKFSQQAQLEEISELTARVNESLEIIQQSPSYLNDNDSKLVDGVAILKKVQKKMKKLILNIFLII